MRLMITRPLDDAAPLAEVLKARGFDVAMAPLLDIRPVDGAAPDLGGVQGLLATSANGVRAFAGKSNRRDLPVWAVGDASARAAREAGFGKVESASGDVDALAALVTERVDAAAGALLHVAGTKLAGDLAGMLDAAGFQYRRSVLYTAETATHFDGKAKNALKGGNIDGVLFFSPRTAETFVTLVRKGRLTKAMGEVVAFCLSPAVAEKVAGLKWREIQVAERPEQDALIECLEKARATGGKDKQQDGNMAAKSQTAQKPEKGDNKKASPAKAGPEKESKAGPEKGPAAKTSPKADAETTSGAKSAASGASPSQQQPSSSPAPAKGQDKKAPGGLGAFVAAVVILGVAAAGATATFDLWYPRLAENLPQAFHPDAPKPASGASADAAADFGALRAERERMREQIDALLKRVGNLETEIKETRKVAAVLSPKAGEAVAELTERVSRLESSPEGKVANADEIKALSDRIASLEEGGTQAAQHSDRTVAEIRARLKELEQESGVQGRQSGASAFVIAVGQLRDAVTTARPFAAELTAVKGMSSAPEIAIAAAVLEPMATRGLPSLSLLQVEFDNIAGEIVRAAVTPEGSGWLERTVQRLSSVITVRRTGEDLSGEGVDAVVARTEAALARGDLTSAVAAIETLEGGPASVASGWLERARSRQAGERALSDIHLYAIGLLARKVAAEPRS